MKFLVHQINTPISMLESVGHQLQDHIQDANYIKPNMELVENLLDQTSQLKSKIDEISRVPPGVAT